MSDSQSAQDVRSRIGRFPLFDAADYHRANLDVPEAESREHVAKHGLREGRALSRPEKVAGWLGTLASAPLQIRPELDAATIAALLTKIATVKVGVFASMVSETGSRDLALRLAADLGLLGIKAEIHHDLRGLGGPEAVNILVSPHEFTSPESGFHDLDPEVIAASFVLSTEAPYETAFFSRLEPLLLAKGVISPQAALIQLLGAADIPSVFWLPTDAPSADLDDPAPDHPLVAGLPKVARRLVSPSDVWADRPLDMLLVCDESEVRGEFLGLQAEFLSGLTCVMRYRRALWRQPGEALIEPRTADYIAKRCKIVLNLHETEIGSLNQASLMHGMAQGAVVVSAPCIPHPLFEPGVHYLEDSLHRIPKLVNWLLQTEEGRRTAERVRWRAMERLAETASIRRRAFNVLEFICGPAWASRP